MEIVDWLSKWLSAAGDRVKYVGPSRGAADNNRLFMNSWLLITSLFAPQLFLVLNHASYGIFPFLLLAITYKLCLLVAANIDCLVSLLKRELYGANTSLNTILNLKGLLPFNVCSYFRIWGCVKLLADTRSQWRFYSFSTSPYAVHSPLILLKMNMLHMEHDNIERWNVGLISMVVEYMFWRQGIWILRMKIMFLEGYCLWELSHQLLNFDIILTYIMDHNFELGRIQRSDGPTKAYTIISGRLVGKSLQVLEGGNTSFHGTKLQISNFIGYLSENQRPSKR